MKKRISLILCVIFVMALLLPGCGGSDTIVGEWVGNIDYSKLMNGYMTAVGIGDYVSVNGLDVEMHMTFGEDGAYSMEISKASLESMMVQFMEQAKPGMRRMMEDMLAGTGTSLDDYLALSGMDFDSLMDQSLAESMDTSALELTVSGKYMVDGDVLYITDIVSEEPSENSEALNIELDGDTLSITGGEMPEEMQEIGDMLFPMVLTRK